MKIYVASSWKNQHQQDVVKALRKAGHDVYDFRNPRPGNHGFEWDEIDPDYRNWDAMQYGNALCHPAAKAGFASDFAAMQWADCFVGVAFFGRSASMEMGYAAGAGKLSILYLPEPFPEPELMVKMFDHLCFSIEAVINRIKEASGDRMSRDELQYIVDQVKEWSMEECAVEQGYACPLREERILVEMEYGESETREAAEKLIDGTSSCGLRGEEGKCWVKYYRREFRAEKGGCKSGDRKAEKGAQCTERRPMICPE